MSRSTSSARQANYNGAGQIHRIAERTALGACNNSSEVQFSHDTRGAPFRVRFHGIVHGHWERLLSAACEVMMRFAGVFDKDIAGIGDLEHHPGMTNQHLKPRGLTIAIQALGQTLHVAYLLARFHKRVFWSCFMNLKARLWTVLQRRPAGIRVAAAGCVKSC